MICLRLLLHCARRAASRADWTAGSIRATRTPLEDGEVMLGTGSRWRKLIPWSSTVTAVDAGKSRGRSWSALGSLSGSIRMLKPGPGASRRALAIWALSAWAICGRFSIITGMVSRGSMMVSISNFWGRRLAIAALARVADQRRSAGPAPSVRAFSAAGRCSAQDQLLLIQRDGGRQHCKRPIGKQTRRELQDIFGACPVLLAELRGVSRPTRRPLGQHLVYPLDEHVQLLGERSFILDRDGERQSRVDGHDRSHRVTRRRRLRRLRVDRQLRPQVLEQIVPQVKAELGADRILDAPRRSVHWPGSPACSERRSDRRSCQDQSTRPRTPTAPREWREATRDRRWAGRPDARSPRRGAGATTWSFVIKASS